MATENGIRAYVNKKKEINLLKDKGVTMVQSRTHNCNELRKENVGENVVVIGGGLTGCEIAYDLYLQGKKPVIVEAKHDLIVSDKVPLPNASYLRDFFISNKVPTYLESSVKEIKENSVVVADKNGNTKEIKADNGEKSPTNTLDSLQNKIEEKTTEIINKIN